ncbi:hypothetical protein ABPG75_004774 [Micractinium tetrahymenae]
MSEQSTTDSIVSFVLENKLKTILYTWAAGITGSLAYEWSRPIPGSLKIIHSRVYAQAITLAALGSVAAVEMYQATHHPDKVKKVDKHGY